MREMDPKEKRYREEYNRRHRIKQRTVEEGPVDEVQQEANHVMSIKNGVTVLLIVILAFLAVKFWNGGDHYQIVIPTKDGYQWAVTACDTEHLKVVSELNDADKGKYILELDGLLEGDATVDVERTDSAGEVCEARTYHLKVVAGNTVIHRSVDREVME